MSFTVWGLVVLLFQGVVAGLIVLFVTHRLQKRKDLELLKKHSLLVYLEIHGHIAMLEDVLQHGAIPQASAQPIFFDNVTWEQSQSYLTPLPIKELLQIGSYYQAALSLNTIMDGCHGHQLTPVTHGNFLQVLTMARVVKHLLAVYWDENVSDK